MTILDTGNVGIGTTSPSHALSVVGDVNITGNFRVNGTVFTGGGGGAMTGVTSISNASGDITLAPAVGTGAVQINSGAASTSPTTGALIVSGGIGVSGGIYTGGAISSGSTVSANTSMYTPQLYGTSTPSGNIRIDGTSDATKGNVLLASAGGNVGIGTGTPGTKLQVNGGAIVGATSGAGQNYTNPGYNNTLGIFGASNSVSSTAGIQFGDGFSGGSRQWGIYNGRASSGQVNGALNFVMSNTVNADAMAGTTVMTMSSAGNVGIGTTTPTGAKLILSTNSSAGADFIKMFDSSTANGEMALGDSASIAGDFLPYLHAKAVNNSANPRAGLMLDLEPSDDAGSSPGLNINARIGGSALTNSPLLVVRNNGTERFRIDAAGNVGIGTTTPATKLDVRAADNTTIATFGNTKNQATFEIRSQGAGQSQGLAFKRTDASYDQFVLSPSSGSHANTLFESAGGIEFTADSQGFGIPTADTTGVFYFSTPAGLTANSGTHNFFHIKPQIMQSGAAGYNGLNVDVDEQTVGSGNRNIVNFATSGTSRMVVTSSGNVGIGTTSPAEKLSVAGTTQFNGNVRQVAGQFSGASYNNAAGTSFDFNNGNVQYTSANCQAMTLSNMQDGGSYTIAVKGTTSGTCSFSHAGLTFHYSPAQGTTVNGSHSTYTFLRVGNDVYVTWIALYQ